MGNLVRAATSAAKRLRSTSRENGGCILRIFQVGITWHRVTERLTQAHTAPVVGGAVAGGGERARADRRSLQRRTRPREEPWSGAKMRLIMRAGPPPDGGARSLGTASEALCSAGARARPRAGGSALGAPDTVRRRNPRCADRWHRVEPSSRRARRRQVPRWMATTRSVWRAALQPGQHDHARHVGRRLAGTPGVARQLGGPSSPADGLGQAEHARSCAVPSAALHLIRVAPGSTPTSP